jgi:hypothetical protein
LYFVDKKLSVFVRFRAPLQWRTLPQSPQSCMPQKSHSQCHIIHGAGRCVRSVRREKATGDSTVLVLAMKWVLEEHQRRWLQSVS